MAGIRIGVQALPTDMTGSDHRRASAAELVGIPVISEGGRPGWGGGVERENSGIGWSRGVVFSLSL